RESRPPITRRPQSEGTDEVTNWATDRAIRFRPLRCEPLVDHERRVEQPVRGELGQIGEPFLGGRPDEVVLYLPVAQVRVALEDAGDHSSDQSGGAGGSVECAI